MTQVSRATCLDSSNAWGNQYWPADYFVDAKGQVRAAQFGEGDYAKSEANNRALLAEAGTLGSGAAKSKPTGVVTPSQEATLETYLGAERAQGWATKPTVGSHDSGVVGATTKVDAKGFRYGGQRQIGEMSATAFGRSTIDAEVQAKNVYRVLGKNATSRGNVRGFVDGKYTKTVGVTDHNLYTLVSMPRDERHRISLQLDQGVTGFAFTFG